ncbi:hypothetical protein [Clostridium pasteurianum]|uniref:Flagellar hook-length control protein FliK n=1 Tax=Clostridium pasteurianum BC1 TaxID=86416 RepID=R4JZG7_CLOPA|nr:hypothetical protein [Clostridium pasteurianum]AGK96222.1 hypothetical protein Clopa_1232 [Clostridium pasteurianum BC1]
MAGISNVNNLVQYNAGKAVRKLSFEIGEVFSAKILDENTGEGEAVLKLNDGWKFSAKLTKDINYDANIFNKFIVEGYEEGKIKIKILPHNLENNGTLIDSQQDILRGYIANTYSKEDYNILKSLLEHNIPLTKENISNVKSLLKFKDNIIENPNKEDEFINQYIVKNNIDVNSDKGKEVKKLLESFFKELKGLSLEELTSFIENGIEINGDNIKSFNKIFKQDAAIYKSLEVINDKINQLNIFEEQKDALKQQIPEKVSDKILGNEVANKEIDNMVAVDEKNNLNKSIENILNNKLNVSLNNDLNKTVINEINFKINFMKGTIKELISKGNLNRESLEKISNILGNNINDIKLFNVISEGYYYVDIPLNFKDNDYIFKFIVKDDRKSGKKIDSKNVKLIASIKTVNMGVIDTFITVNNKNLNVDIKSEHKWVKLLKAAKDNFLNKIDMGYTVSLKVKPKESEVDIASCRSFFNNECSNNIDRRV